MKTNESLVFWFLVAEDDCAEEVSLFQSLCEAGAAGAA